MGLPGDLLSPFLSCMNPTMVWPSIVGPGGLPNFGLSTLLSMMGGIGMVLDFIPPDPLNLPPPPTPEGLMGLFTAPFLGSLTIPGDLGEIDLSIVVPGAPTLPASG